MSTPPALPQAPKTYDPDYINRLLRILTQYMTQTAQDVNNTSGSTTNSQFNSLGVGTTPSGTAGDLKATTIEATTVTSNLKGTVDATTTGGAGLTPTNATNATNVVGSGTISATTTGTTQTTGTNNTTLATTAFVLAETALNALLAGSSSQTFSAANGTSSNQVVNISQFSASLATNGYQKLASGLILQWGKTGSVAVGGPYTVTFPISFPNAAFFATSIPTVYNDVAQTAPLTASLSTTAFTYYNSTGVSNAFLWFAVGY